MPDEIDNCWFCNDAAREVGPPGGWILQDEWWRVGHGLPGWGPAGTTIVESRRHFLDVSEMNADEAAGFGPLLGSVVGAVKQAVGADRVYTWSTMTRHPHLHVWLIPWWGGSPDHGPDYLKRVLKGGCDETDAIETAGRMRELLSPSAGSPGTLVAWASPGAS